MKWALIILATIAVLGCTKKESPAPAAEETAAVEEEKPAVEPIKLYDTLDREVDKGPLRPAQAVVLGEWHETHRKQRDVIVKLHTGQGKTLVGLLDWGLSADEAIVLPNVVARSGTVNFFMPGPKYSTNFSTTP